MGRLGNLFKKKEDGLKEVIAVEPFRDYRANNKFRYKIRTKGSNGTTYSGLLLARATFPEIGQMINPNDWTSVNQDEVYKEDWQNMYGAKSISELHEMPKIAEVCVDVLKGSGEYLIHLGVGLFLVLPNITDANKVSLENFDYLGYGEFEGAYITELFSYGSIVPLGYVLKSAHSLETCKQQIAFSGDALTALNLAIKTLQEQKSEAAKKIDEMAAFNKLYNNENAPATTEDTSTKKYTSAASALLGGSK